MKRHCLNLIDRRQLSEDVAKVGLETKGKDEISLIDDQHGQGGGQVKVSVLQVLRETA